MTQETNKKLFLSVDTDQIDFKNILKKNFLELKMKAISTANPNRNKTWFTRESLEASKESFYNKPILGYFNNGDFTSHEGVMRKDPDTKISYWDVNNGERILGAIRESDEVKIIDDEEAGISWIVFSCFLWTQYCYKQVKRLLKDAKQAKDNGDPVKNISVEVDITDYEELDNGILKINKFELQGVTILGSKNQKKVEPGIEGAELSVNDVMGREVYSQQQQALRMAYAELEDGKSQKEDKTLENENLGKVVSEPSVAATNEEPVVEPVVEEPKIEEEPKTNETHEEPVNEPVKEPEGQIQEEPVREPGVIEPATQEPEHEEKGEGEGEGEVEGKQENFSAESNKQGTINDIVWLLSDSTYTIRNIEASLEYYKSDACGECPHKEEIIMVLERIVERHKDNEKDIVETLAALVNTEVEVSPETQASIQIYAKYPDKVALAKEYEELNAKFEEMKGENEKISAENAEFKVKFAESEHVKFMEEAKKLINKAKIEDAEVVKNFEEKCSNKTICDLVSLKQELALYCFDHKTEPVDEGTKTKQGITLPLDVPNPTVVFESNKNKTAERGTWDILKENVRD